MPSSYTVKRVDASSIADGHWDRPAWKGVSTLAVDYFHPKSSAHHPKIAVQLLHDGKHVFVHFEAQDQYVLSRSTEYQQMVCTDSCVEFFARPKADKGYFNFEMNAGGNLLLYYIEDPTRTDSGFKKYTPVPKTSVGGILIHHSLPAVVMPERTEPLTWHLSARIPFSMMEEFVGPLGQISNTTWRANFFKCADQSSHPHWASWAPFDVKLNFHQPQYFGTLQFA